MSDYGAPPTIPSSLQVYNSYQEDPKWQKKFTIVWATAVGIAVLAALPQLIRAVRSRQAFTGLFGVWEDLSGSWYGPAAAQEAIPPRRSRKVAALLRTVGSVLLWSPMGFGLDLGQIVVVVGYVATVLVCITMQAPLMDNPNRAGFLAIAQLPVVFLFGTKNSILSLLLGPGNGYEKLNYVHRWAGRGVFLGAAIHGSLWIRNHLQYDLPILGQQKETSGVAAFALLCIIVLTSLRPVRVFFYQCFFIVHVLTYVAFFVTLCYHTIYASPWIYPPLAFYGLDLLMRMFRYRIKDATLVPADDQMTLIHVRDCDGGWKAGQHVRLRVFFGGRVFESHPLTIMNAPAATSCTSTRTIALGARVKGDWTRALNRYAKEEQSRIAGALGEKKEDVAEIPVQVMLDGPYGGCSVDLGRYESVLLLAGGAGATFTLSLLDDIVGRCVKLGRRNGERTRRIEFAWAIRSFGCIEWFAPMLMEIASAAAGSSIDLHISVFVTCLCNPEAVPPIPNSMVTVEKPSIQTLLKELITPPAAREDAESMKADLRWAGEGGGVAVCASGPERMTREAQNAVAKLSVSHGMRMGGIALHTELFSL
ncbi:ferric reductase [Heterobasidion irregulare TC 32-1]|uniref:ferric-chelate reductase (NADPH) n=1 Tax=Heterobasidion irregulare (strain TC 32-1) TaxID=747525 RepID=W4K1J6_HETIT|nr:ferric reductase [Heterobasidion irregulare TC 32-1]ETW79594.1 ferric reductase [Heterobasidion irregulare TC 32-1]